MLGIMFFVVCIYILMTIFIIIWMFVERFVILINLIKKYFETNKETRNEVNHGRRFIF